MRNLLFRLRRDAARPAGAPAPDDTEPDVVTPPLVPAARARLRTNPATSRVRSPQAKERRSRERVLKVLDNPDLSIEDTGFDPYNSGTFESRHKSEKSDQN